MRFSKEDILFLHEQLTAQTGGDPSLRDENMLDLAVNSPYHTFGGVDLYDGIVRKSVHLCYSLVMNHPFVDGNKRIGTHALVTLLYANGYELIYEDQELIDIILALASSKLTEEELLEWVNNHIVK